jgi:hypothetical protein
MNAPQADDIDKILDLPLAVADGANTKYRLTKRYGFDGRQTDYYLEVAEMLGLASRENGIYILSEDGKKYLRMDPGQQKLMVIRKMIAVPIVSLLIGELATSAGKALSKEEIERLIEDNANIHGTTVGRRARSLMTWFRWIGEETGLFSVDNDFVRMRVLADHA